MLFQSLAILLCAVSGVSGASLWLETTPQSVMPYALKKGKGIRNGMGDTWNTYPITGNSSGKAFCLLNTNGPGQLRKGSAPGLFPHVHKKTYENFYSFKGRVQLWGQNLDSYLGNSSIQTTRILGPGDFGGIPLNTIHTFALLEPDTQLTGVLVPGGFEEFFFNMASTGFQPAALAKWDVYPQTDFAPRTDTVDGRAGPGNWYDGANNLPEGMSSPIWVAKNYGPKWLSSQGGRYQIVTPFVTPAQTDNMFSQGTLTVSMLSAGKAAPRIKSPVATAFQMEEGQLALTVEGYDTIHLIEGDVAFIPGNTSFSYAAEADFTNTMYVSGAGRGFEVDLMEGGKAWNSAFYPQSAAYVASTSRDVHPAKLYRI